MRPIFLVVAECGKEEKEEKILVPLARVRTGCVDLGGRRNFWCPNPSLEPRYFSLSPKLAIELSI